ncbi:MAG: M48 family metallopeptidase [Synechococcales cyanobacterium RM1_1_8]|nr:M48 family metallopeptidase [Synechococcales cyanobacterium RM1_1_8]
MDVENAAAKTPLFGLKADQFRHPLDRQATQTLKQLPGLDIAIRSLLGPTAEEVFYLDNIASSILIGPQQLPDLHRLLTEACAILDIEAPALYLKQNPAPNAYTFAMRGKKPFIVIHSSLLDLLEPEEIQAVIAHELGHLKCDHGVYLTLANLIILGTGLLGGAAGSLLTQGLQNRMMEWVRCAEFTCDRAALLVSQEPRTVASLMMKLTGGSPALAQQLNLDAFLDQARAYDLASGTELGQAIEQMQTAPLSHPLPVLRAREIDRWASSKTYQDLLLQGAAVQGARQAKGWW